MIFRMAYRSEREAKNRGAGDKRTWKWARPEWFEKFEQDAIVQKLLRCGACKLVSNH